MVYGIIYYRMLCLMYYWIFGLGNLYFWSICEIPGSVWSQNLVMTPAFLCFPQWTIQTLNLLSCSHWPVRAFSFVRRNSIMPFHVHIRQLRCCRRLKLISGTKKFWSAALKKKENYHSNKYRTFLRRLMSKIRTRQALSSRKYRCRTDLYQ